MLKGDKDKSPRVEIAFGEKSKGLVDCDKHRAWLSNKPRNKQLEINSWMEERNDDTQESHKLYIHNLFL